jgi:hypothetical protein
MMARNTITIQLDPDAARAYEAAPAADKRKMQVLLSLWLRELATSEPSSLKEAMSDLGRKARERGLTPEALQSLLKGA